MELFGKPRLPVRGDHCRLRGDRVDVALERQRHHVGVEAVDDRAGLGAGAAMRLLDGDGLAGLLLPVGGEGRVVGLVELAGRIVGDVEKRNIGRQRRPADTRKRGSQRRRGLEKSCVSCRGLPAVKNADNLYRLNRISKPQAFGNNVGFVETLFEECRSGSVQIASASSSCRGASGCGCCHRGLGDERGRERGRLQPRQRRRVGFGEQPADGAMRLVRAIPAASIGRARDAGERRYRPVNDAQHLADDVIASGSATRW